MPPKILQRYVIKDFLRTTLLALLVLTLIFLLATSLRMVRRFRDLEVDLILELLPLLVYSTLSMTLPISLLAGCTLTFSRLANDNEITAMRACGVHLSTVVAPLLVLCGLTSIGAYFIGSQVVPNAKLKARQIAHQAAKQAISGLASQDPQTIDYIEGFQIFYNGLDEQKRFKNLVIHRLDPKGQVTEEIMADRGKFEFGASRVTMRLERGSIAMIRSQLREGGDPKARKEALERAAKENKKGDKALEFSYSEWSAKNERRETQWVGFNEYTMTVALPEEASKVDVRPSMMAQEQLIKEIQRNAYQRLEVPRTIKDMERYHRDVGMVIKASETRKLSDAPWLVPHEKRLRERLPWLRERFAQLPPTWEEAKQLPEWKGAPANYEKRYLRYRRQVQNRLKWVAHDLKRDVRWIKMIRDGDPEEAIEVRRGHQRFNGQLKFQKDLLKRRNRDYYKSATELHSRFSIPLACLLIVLLGAPLGMMVQHANKLVAFAISAIPVFAIYYPLLMIGEWLGESGKLEPLIAMQMPNVIIGGAGMLLLWRVYSR